MPDHGCALVRVELPLPLQLDLERWGDQDGY